MKRTGYGLAVLAILVLLTLAGRAGADGVFGPAVTVGGTVTTSPAAGVTQAVSGGVTATPSGTTTVAPGAGATFTVGGTITPAPAGTQTTFVANTVTVAGTVTCSPAAGATTTITGTATPVVLSDLTVTGTLSGSGNLTLNTAGYTAFSFTIPVGTWSAGNILVQFSSDNGSNYQTCPMTNSGVIANTTQPSSTSTTLTFATYSDRTIMVPGGTTQVRLSASSITGTTGTCILAATTTPGCITYLGGWTTVGGVIGAVSVGQINGTAVSAGTGAVGTGCQRVAVAVDSATVAGSASLPTGTNKIGTVHQDGAVCTHMTTNTTTTAKSGAGVLHTIVINTRGVGNTATIYDNTAGSGTVIAVIDTTLSTTSFTYDGTFSTGLTVVTAGGTPPDITITTY